MAKCDIMAEPLAYFMNLRFIRDWKNDMHVAIGMRIRSLNICWFIFELYFNLLRI